MAYLPAEDIFRARLDRADVLNNAAFQRHDQASLVATGGAMYYSNGFLPAGGGQTASAGGGGGLLSAITSGLETFLPAIFNRPTAVTPPIIPRASVPVGGAIPVAGIPGRVMGAITKTASQHPVLTAAGGAAATVGGAVMAHRMGRKVSIRADGTIRHHRRMNPCNIHALRRGLRRASAFERIAKRVLHITSPRKHVSGFKLPHRKKR